MFSRIPRRIARRGLSVRNIAASFEGYGQHLFKGAVAAPYLVKAGLPANTLDTVAWTSNGNADKVCNCCHLYFASIVVILHFFLLGKNFFLIASILDTNQY